MKTEYDASAENSKFSLDGTIHSKSISSYIEDQVELSKRRILIAFLLLGAAAALLQGAISQNNLFSQQDKISTLSHYKQALVKTENSL